MAATITIEEVKAFVNTSAPDFIIQGLIDTADGADACLDGLGLTDDQVKSAKLYFAAYQLTASSRGDVVSESTKSGASRTYSGGSGLSGNGYGQQLQSMAGGQCLISQLGNQYSAFLDVVVVDNA
ncbi:MAG: hypothetical protein KTR16_11615 [Acidiferrobacterales bacterium]|nr:hypothetical protein [Acidiferrobacterales bacterium]